MLLLLLLLALLIYSNIRIARKKGKNVVLWGAITLFAFFLSYCLLGGIYISIIYKGAVTKEALTSYLMNEPLAVAMLSLLGIGGVLLVRFILERTPVKKVE